VLMSPLGKPGVSAELSVGARLPHLLAIGMGLLAAGFVFAVIGGGVIYAAARRRT